MKALVQSVLKFFAKKILIKYHPLVIGITGSVGKTTAKEAVSIVLAADQSVRQSVKNYNNEIGVPLTIIGVNTPGRSVIGWLIVFVRAFWLLITKINSYPEILVLEMGIDRPGDMDYLLSIVHPQIGLVTFIGSAHLEYFGTIEKIQKEKGKLVEALPKDGWAIINYDNERTKKTINLSKARVITYGIDDKADIVAKEIVFSFDFKGEVRGVSFKMVYQGSAVPVFLPGVLGTNAVYAALAGAAAGIIKQKNLVTIATALNNLRPLPGRMNLVKGIKHTFIIDDTYNSSPQAVLSALGILKELPIKAGRKRIAVLGDMLELGDYSEEGHQEVGKYLAKLRIDKLISVGERSRDIARGAKAAGMNEDEILYFADVVSAGSFVRNLIKEGDMVLIKGSQGMRMEKIVKEIMAEPEKSQELLVRQDKEWLKY
jgi:UDP-N-acetylmuramoyl-tripeptide--D-alanyl-D-alanine ligase